MPPSWLPDPTRAPRGGRLEIAVCLDAPEENWPSMDLAGEMLLAEWRTTLAAQVDPVALSISIPRVARRIPGLASSRRAWNADRALTRYAAYPLRAAAARRPQRYFHVVDHSYAHLAHVLPAGRTGVYCHDLDAFRAITSPEAARRFHGARALARILLEGLRRARIVFHNTKVVGRVLAQHVPEHRLVHAPYGVAPEFTPTPDPSDGAERVLGPLEGRPFLLHVGSEIPRKRLDVLFETFARLHARRPELRLVQQGARLSAEQVAHVERLRIGGALLQPPKLPRATLAGLYRRASVVLLPSDAEGFGFPVIEALASGALLVASDLPVLREVGGDAALYAPAGDAQAWAAIVDAILAKRVAAPAEELRRARASEFTWERHARTVLDAYRRIA